MRCDKRDRFNAVDLGLCGEDALGIWWSVHPAIVELRTPKVWRVLTAFMFGTEKPDLSNVVGLGVRCTQHAVRCARGFAWQSLIHRSA